MSHPVVAANGVVQPLFDSWTVDSWVVVPLTLAAGIYMRGWLRLHTRVPQRFGGGHLAAFLGGLTAIAVALESPLHTLGAQLLQAHMVQHLLLMMVAPPLLWLGAPLLPLVQGLPRGILRMWVGPLFAWRSLSHIVSMAHLPTRGLGGLRGEHLGLAHPSALRTSAGLRALARGAARLLSGDCARFLVASGTALAEPHAGATLGHRALFDPGGSAKHRALCLAGVCRAAHLPIVRSCPPAMGDLSAQ